MDGIERLKKNQKIFRTFIEEDFFLKNKTLLNQKETLNQKKNQKNKIFSTFQPFKKINLKKAKEIYKRNYFETLTSVLKDTFPVTLHFLKNKIFESLARNYILKYPATSPLLSDYGQEFPNFIKKSLFQFPFLRDLAFFEWQLKELTLSPFESFIENQTIETKNKDENERLSLKKKQRIKKIIQQLKLYGDNTLFKKNLKFLCFSSAFPIFDLWKIFNNEIQSPQTQNPSLNSLLKKKTQKKDCFFLIKNDKNDITVEKVHPYDHFILENFFDFCPISENKKKFLKYFLPKKSKKTHKVLENKDALTLSYIQALNRLIQKEALTYKKLKS